MIMIIEVSQLGINFIGVTLEEHKPVALHYAFDPRSFVWAHNFNLKIQPTPYCLFVYIYYQSYTKKLNEKTKPNLGQTFKYKNTLTALLLLIVDPMFVFR